MERDFSLIEYFGNSLRKGFAINKMVLWFPVIATVA